MIEQDLYAKCCFCSKTISKGAPLSSIDSKRANADQRTVIIQTCHDDTTCKHHNFCDIICAKLFNDNISPININITKYNKDIASKLVCKKAEGIFMKTNGVLFKMLPTYKPDDPDIREDVSLMKKKYRAILSHIKFD